MELVNCGGCSNPISQITSECPICGRPKVPIYKPQVPPSKVLFSFQGRIPRGEFLDAWLNLLILTIFVGFLMTVIRSSGEVGGAAGVIICFLWLILCGWVGLAIQVKRWHDIGYSGWMVLLGLIPIIGLIVFVYLAFIKGTAGPNNYGDDPLQVNA